MTLTMRRFFYFSFAFIAWFQSYNSGNNSFNYGNPIPIAAIPIETQLLNGTGSDLALAYPGGYIIAESDAGLSNRLRVLAAYMYIAQANYNGAHLVFAWDVNSACPGHFLEIFQPIPNLIFMLNSSRSAMEKNAKISFEVSNAVFSWTLLSNNIPRNKFGGIQHDMYRKFLPTRNVMDKVTQFVRAYNICSSSAMHVRQTDLNLHLSRRKKRTTDWDSYYTFIESRPKEENIFLLSDNPEAQHHFIEKYGAHKIIVYTLMASIDEQKPFGTSRHVRVLTSKEKKKELDVIVSKEMKSNLASSLIMNSSESNIINDNTNNSINIINTINSTINTSTNAINKTEPSSAPRLREDHRYSSLEHTLIDVLIAAHSKKFKPSTFSSISDLVNIFGKIGKNERGFCR